MRNAQRILAATVAVALLSAPLCGCSRGGANPPQAAVYADRGGVPAGQPGGEVAAVKETLKQLSQQKSPSGMAPYFSNRSAAVMGLMMTIPLAMMSAFAEMGEQMSKEMQKSFPQNGKSAANVEQDRKLKAVKAVLADVEIVMKKYGMEKGGQKGPEAMRLFEGRGREFLSEIGGLIDRFSKTEAGKGQDLSMSSKDLVKDIHGLEFKVVSPTEVKIVDSKKKPNDPDLRAIVENGKWRLDFGGLDELGKLMSGGQPAKPHRHSAGAKR